MSEENVCGSSTAEGNLARGHAKKVVKPSHRCEMAQQAKQVYGISVKLACIIFSISEVCHPHKSHLLNENYEIADWLIRLTAGV